MKTRDFSIGAAFLHQSLYETESLQVGKQAWYGPGSEPLTFKIFEDVEFYSLQQHIPFALGDARWSFQEFRQEQDAVPHFEKLTLEFLSTLLYYTYGFSRYDNGPGVTWPFHRFVASARCLFPTELYLWLPQTEQFPAGIYHYDALHHGLALIRAGDYRHFLGKAIHARLDDCECILLLSSFFWKTAFRYMNFAYRLCTQEAGLVVGNALMVAATCGLLGRVHCQFLDRPLNQLLGLEPGEESLLALISLSSWKFSTEQDRTRDQAHVTAQAMCKEISTIQLEYKKTSLLNRERCARLLELDQNSFFEDTAEILTEAVPDFTHCALFEERIAPPTLSPEPAELAQALQNRNSGDVDFLPLPTSLAHNTFWEIVRCALSAYRHDRDTQLTIPWLQLYISINNVIGLDKGIYRFCSKCNELHVVSRCDPSLPLQSIQTQGNINSAQANMICFIVGSYEAAGRLFGNRAYRMLNIEAGIVGQRISIMSASHGLTARYSNSYLPAPCRELLHLADSALVPLAELIIGHERAGSHANQRYRLSLRS